jgi:CHAT domain-containing protein/Tfp pilus assembly protein PilF
MKGLSIGILAAGLAAAQAPEFDAGFLERLLAAPSETAAKDLVESTPASATSALAAELDRRGVESSAKNDNPSLTKFEQLAVLVADHAGDARLQSKARGNLAVGIYRLGNVKEALALEREALEFSAKVGADDLAGNQWLIACGALVSLGEQSEAETYCLKGIEISTRLRDRVLEARGHNELAQVYKARTQFRPALEQYQASLRLAEAANQEMGVAFVTNNIGALLLDQGDLEEALPYFERSLKIKRANGSLADQISTISNLAEAHRRLGQFAQAGNSLKESIGLCEKLHDSQCRGKNLNNLAMLEFNQGNFTLAAQHVREAISLLDPADLPGLQVNLARVLNASGKTGEALEPARNGLQGAQRMGIQEDERRGWHVLGLIARDRGNLAEAEADFYRSIEVLESIRADVAGDEITAQRYFEDNSGPYLSLVEVLVEQRKLDAAFQASERAKARVLLDSLAGGKARPIKGLTTEEQAKEIQLRREITRLNGRMLAEQTKTQDPKRVAQLAADVDHARAEYSGFEKILYTEHPELRLDRVEMAPPTAAEAAATFANRRVDVIDFTAGDSAVYAFVFSSRDRKMHFFRVAASRDDLYKKCARFAEELARRDLGFAPLARELYHLLIEPAEPWLARDSTLAVVPDGSLWQVPFQALEPAENHYLIEKHALFCAPSTTVLREIIRRSAAPQPHEPRLLALGNPALSVSAGQAPLLSAESEVGALASIYGDSNSRVLTGARATEAAFKDNAARYDVIHVAAHGFLNSRNPMYSNILLAPGSSAEDGFLEAREILKLDLRGEIVVLSACEMAGGRFGQGEGLIGMSWAFFVAGSRATVASQWKVDSASTTALMTSFHRELRGTLAQTSGRFAKSQALQHAMLDVLSKPSFSHPFYWAAFVLLGDGF